jgi:hypothetical protein
MHFKPCIDLELSDLTENLVPFQNGVPQSVTDVHPTLDPHVDIGLPLLGSSGIPRFEVRLLRAV